MMIFGGRSSGKEICRRGTDALGFCLCCWELVMSSQGCVEKQIRMQCPLISNISSKGLKFLNYFDLTNYSIAWVFVSSWMHRMNLRHKKYNGQSSMDSNVYDWQDG